MFSQIPLPNPLATQSFNDVYAQAAMIPRKLQAQDLMNAMAQMQNQFYPRKADADIANTEANTKNTLGQATQWPFQNALTEANTKNVLAQATQWPYQNALTAANTRYKNAETTALPINTLTNAQNSLNSSNRFNSSYQMLQFIKTLPEADRNLYISQHRDEYDRAMADIANPQNTMPQVLTPQMVAQAYPNAGIQAPQPQNPLAQQQQGQAQGGQGAINPLANQQGAPPVQNALVQGQQQQPQADPYGRPAYDFRSTPEQIAEQQRASLASANNSLVTTATRERAEGARILDQWVADKKPQLNKMMKNASLYAGAAGKGKAGWDALANQNPEAYQDYLSFQHQFIPNAINQVKKIESLGASDSQRDELTEMFTKAADEATSNPERALAYYNSGLQMITDIGAAANKQSQPLGEALTVQGQEPQTEAPVGASAKGGGEMVTIRLKDGRVGEIPKSKLKDAVDKYGAVVESNG